MKQKVTIVHKWGDVELFRETYVYHIKVDTTVDSQYTHNFLKRINRMLTPGTRTRGDVTI